VVSHPSLSHPTDEDLSVGTPDCAKDGAPIVRLPVGFVAVDYEFGVGAAA